MSKYSFNCHFNSSPVILPVILIKIYIQNIGTSVMGNVISGTIHEKGFVYPGPLWPNGMNLIIGLSGSVATIKINQLIQELVSQFSNVKND